MRRPESAPTEARSPGPEGPGGASDTSDGRTAPRRQKAWRRWITRLLAALALFIVVLSMFTAYFFIWPPGRPPDRADAVIVLSGDHGERLPVALQMIERGVARTLVLDGTPDFPLWLELCEKKQAFEVVCLRPNPDGTRPEARAAGRLAAERRWKSVVVVTTTYHVTRSAMLFRRCVDGEVSVVRAHRTLAWRSWALAIGREWLAVGNAAVFRREC